MTAPSRQIVSVTPSERLEGSIVAPASKSYSHRAFFAALLTRGESVIRNPLVDGDLEVTIRVCRTLGLEVIEKQGTIFRVRGPSEFSPPPDPVDIKNSGTSVRILASVAALIPGETSFQGVFFERGRPMEPLLDAFGQLGIKFHQERSSLTIIGSQLLAGDVRIRGDVSSQFITSLLMVLPLARPVNSPVSRIILTTPLKSAPYVKMTIKLLKDFGIVVEESQDDRELLTFTIPAGQEYQACEYQVPGDYSSIAFPIVATTIMTVPSEIRISNLDPADPQGDRAILEVLQSVGATITHDVKRGEIMIQSPGNIELSGPIQVKGTHIPDLIPILVVLATQLHGTSHLGDIEHVRFKESDRLAVMTRELSKMGANIIESRDHLEITGPTQLSGTHFDPEGDHRVFMACIVAALVASTESIIDHPQLVRDSYPTFFDDLTRLGARFQIRPES